MALIKFDTGFNASFFTGVAASMLVPGTFPVALDGRPYQVQWDHTQIGVWGARFKRDSLPLLRSQADQSNVPGEQSISPQNFWRRSQENWISGSGQKMQDRGSSIGTRFYTSKGINPWSPYQLTLLNQTANKRASANTSLNCLVAGTFVYLTNGATLEFSSGTLASWTGVTGTPNAATSICTDGATVYTAHGASGVYSTTAGGATSASYATGTATLVDFVKGRLMAAGGTSVYNIIAAGALPAALFTKGTGWNWVGFAGGQTQIYMAGYSGDKSLIYRTAILADATALAAPIVAGELPDGEIIRSIKAYLSNIIIGSDLGVRFCTVDSSGNLTVGALITTTSPVYASEGQDRFIWYGLTNYDSLSSGIGRMDLTTFTTNSTPAYASDLMATGQGTVRSIRSFGNARLFTVDGVGLFYETLATPVSTGNLVTGWITYGISDPKVAVYLDLKHDPLTGTVASTMATDGTAGVVLGTSASQGAAYATFQANQATGLQYQITFTMTPTTNVSPILTRWTLRSYPAPVRASQFLVPILLFPVVRSNRGDSDYPLNPETEYQAVVALHKAQKIVTFQLGNDTYQVIVYDYQWLPDEQMANGDMQGTMLLYLNEITG
jgi:hypothetical protein